MGEIAKEYDAAIKIFEESKKSEKLRTFRNTVEGLPYEGPAIPRME